jgi:hypothetical protein
MTLGRLRHQPDGVAALADPSARPVQRYSTRMVTDGDIDDQRVLVALWEPDAAYPSTPDGDPAPLDTPGPRHRLYMTPGGWHLEDSSVEAGG